MMEKRERFREIFSEVLERVVPRCASWLALSHCKLGLCQDVWRRLKWVW
jgi:hypothetical protein